MPIYPYNANAKRDWALTLIVRRHNASNGTSVTNLQYLDAVIDGKLDAFIADIRNSRRSEIEQKYEDATPAVKAAVNSALGYTE